MTQLAVCIVAHHFVVLLLRHEGCLVLLLLHHLSLERLLLGGLLLEQSLLDTLGKVLLARHGVILLLAMAIHLARLLVALLSRKGLLLQLLLLKQLLLVLLLLLQVLLLLIEIAHKSSFALRNLVAFSLVQ